MSADDNAPEQAREVEVVARALGRHAGWTDQELDEVVVDTDDVGYSFTGLPRWHQDVPEAEAVLAALAPIRETERWAVFREGVKAAGSYGHEDGWTHDMNPHLDNPYRADGVTGRSGT